jgi:hypothetical protein
MTVHDQRQRAAPCLGFAGEQVNLLELASAGGLGLAHHPGFLGKP